MNYEHDFQIGAKEYVEIWTLLSSKTWRKVLRRLLLFGIVVACFLWEYTVGIGIILLILAVLGIVMPQIIPWTMRKNYNEMPILQQPFSYGLDTEGIWAKSEGYFYKIAWKHLSMWREKRGLLVLQSYGKLPFYYPIEDLKRLGLYTDVMEKVRAHAKPFDKRKEKKRQA